MTDIIQFPTKSSRPCPTETDHADYPIDTAPAPTDQEPEAHMAGPAVCTHCKHTWEAVAPTGSYILECPECLTSHGIWKGPAKPPDGEAIFRCRCGSELFYIGAPDPNHPDPSTEAEIRCNYCGALQLF